MKKAKSNNEQSEKLVSSILFFANVWTTLFAPALIGVGVSYYYGLKEDEPLSIIFWVALVIVSIIHLAVAYIQHINNRKYTLYSEAVSIETEVEKLRHELATYKHGYKEFSYLCSNQMTTIFCLANYIDSAVGELNHFEAMGQSLSKDQFDALLKGKLEAIIRLISIEKEALFSYSSDSLYNIALYNYDFNSKKLKVLVRDCDNRLQKRNREWSPGHGHVGLAFLHKRIKICPDITLSNELMNYSDSDTDNSRYRSFFSIPILRCDDDGKAENGKLPFGVLVLTSAKAEQFREDRDLQFLSTIVKFLAIYLAAAEAFKTHNLNDVGEKDEQEQ
ncbi:MULTISPECIES: GAF domain-containing protein [Pseudoalteromonas]|uniref:GAF domain-containing protein n=1 Tax=Pseudoalteromonas amylolytica TaxID=1859457 RepID=A0A1S1MWM2_9GAMM|nr:MULTISPECIES: GAF domain-containing protein [Pseudoalteromonas]OHU91856.1 hypothetical protein BFC16_02525 [Pseudoalteromonas sp. JW3]OHU93182.1 hypothetical protein BET10_02435 [Pseudoalteromonas amylolytica]